jgi:DcmR-like sensory protein
MEGNDTSLQIAPSALDGRNRHICAFFNGMDEHYQVLQSFIKDGFDHRDKAFHLIDPERREDHLRRLADAGIDVEEAIASGQLEVRPWEDGPLHGDRFDQDTWLAGFEEVLQSGPASGYAKTRFLAQMEWALVDLPGIEDLIEFETRVNYIVPKYDNSVICAYDLSKFGASTVMYALRTHPAVIIGGLLQENPFYVDPDQLLLELREQQSHVGAGIAH